MKKSIAFLMVLTVCLSFFGGFSVTAFPDVTEDNTHFEAVTYLTEKKVIDGYEDGTFKPENTITRAEFVKMLLEFLGFGNIYGDSIVKTSFSDVDAKEMAVTTKGEDGKDVTTTKMSGQHWAAGYIKLAVDKAVVNGYGDGTFRPDAPVTYEEAIKMIVCCLGREEHAKTRAETLKMPLWPDGYLSIGNDLMVGKATNYALGANATRSNVAQMLYNVKDVKIYIAPTIDIGGTGATGGVGGGGGGGGGGSSTVIIPDLYTTGQVVAAVKDPLNTKKTIMIDDGIVIDNKLVTTLNPKYIILKLEVPIENNNYEIFYTGGTDYSHYIGQRVKLKYRYNPDGGVDGRFEVDGLTVRENNVKTIYSQNFKRDRTTQKNLSSSEIYICHTVGSEDYDECLFTDDLNSLTVIYNNKVVDVEQLRDEYLANNPTYSGDRDDIDIITLDDLMPQTGYIMIVDGYDDNSIDAIWVSTTETYVVQDRSFSTNPKRITDKFRIGSGGTPEVFVINDTDPEYNINIQMNGQKIETMLIPQNSILTVAKSKCGKDMDIVVERPTTVTKAIKSTKLENGIKKSITMSDNTTYLLSKYFLDYVDRTIEYENGDNLTLYLNNKNEVIWATVSEAPYLRGYLISAVYSESAETLTLDILTTGGTIVRYEMSSSKTRYITQATDCLSSVTPDKVTITPGGGEERTYKNLRKSLILESLRENAALINAGKSSTITQDAIVSQPIMYTLSSGTSIYTLVTLEPDLTNQYTGESLKYRKVSGTHKFSNADESKSFSVPTDATIVFVPNSRRSYDAKGYKIGTISSLASKFIEYTDYNIEPFYTTDPSTQTAKRTMFVVYNESIDYVPNYRSENMIVTSIDEQLSGTSTIYNLKGYVGPSTSIKTYQCLNQDAYKNAYVLDENFERKTEGGVAVRREVEIGDVIRVGFTPIGTVARIDIIFDVSEAYKSEAPKSTAVSKIGETLPLNNLYFNELVYYYARIGEVTSIDPSITPEWCKIQINGGVESQLYIGSGYNSKRILFYDYSEPNIEKRVKTTLNNEPLTMESLIEGDMVFVWQGEREEIKQIYAIRYPVGTDS
ncbi:MAG: S-layer homology domain-containing protein [Monoglobales bacterium]